MKGRDRRPRWKRAVYAGCPGMTAGCQVLLLRLLDDMDASGYVSIPRSKLASQLGVAPARISERIKLARSLGFLAIDEIARPTRTAVYQATIPDADRGTESVPHDEDATHGHEVRKPVTVMGTESVPPPGEIHAQERYACTPPIGKRPQSADADRRLPEERLMYGEPGQSRGIGKADVDGLPNEGNEERSA